MHSIVHQDQGNVSSLKQCHSNSLMLKICSFTTSHLITQACKVGEYFISFLQWCKYSLKTTLPPKSYKSEFAIRKSSLQILILQYWSEAASRTWEDRYLCNRNCFAVKTSNKSLMNLAFEFWIFLGRLYLLHTPWQHPCAKAAQDFAAKLMYE